MLPHVALAGYMHLPSVQVHVMCYKVAWVLQGVADL